MVSCWEKHTADMLCSCVASTNLTDPTINNLKANKLLLIAAYLSEFRYVVFVYSHLL